MKVDDQAAFDKMPMAHEVLTAASDSVQIEGVDHRLMTFAVQLGYLHFMLFGSPLVITAGTESEHCDKGSHQAGRALDFQTHDKAADEMMLFMSILTYAAPRQLIRVLDHRVGPDGDRVHVGFYG